MPLWQLLWILMMRACSMFMKRLLIQLLDNKDTLFVQVLLHHFQGYHVEVKDSTAGLGLGIVPRSNQPPNTDVYRLTIVSSKVLQDRTTSNKAPIMLLLHGGQINFFNYSPHYNLNKLGRPNIKNVTYHVLRSSATWFWRRRF